MFPKSIQSNLPSDYKNYYTCIYSAYTELLRANSLNLFTYIANNDNVTLANTNNYDRQLIMLNNEFEKFKILLPNETQLTNIPRHHSVIKLELEKCLSSKTNDDNIKLIIYALFKGTTSNTISIKTNLSKKTEKEKFEKFLKQNLKFKRRTTKK